MPVSFAAVFLSENMRLSGSGSSNDTFEKCKVLLTRFSMWACERAVFEGVRWRFTVWRKRSEARGRGIGRAHLLA